MALCEPSRPTLSSALVLLVATVGLGGSGFHDIAAVSGTLSGVGDTCSLRATYPPVLHLSMALHSISSLSEPLHTFCPTHPHLYIASYYFTPGLCHRHGSFLGAGVRIRLFRPLFSCYPGVGDGPTTRYLILMCHVYV